ncbi:zinc finger and BTB domain-containing protein 44 isoform X2 [Nerophis ophidion]|uniref:zinc finger and BTB domain-containing protein 44 isoform X2 n=1 Tax=Nerophis ophidion TaxID=159077 RepID=UPI002ADF40C1|nr:zinc finger and BTB domain-containing protein 44 isoform X2 [Nerophis ophidion]
MGVKTFTHNSTSHSQEMLEKLNALRNQGHLCDVTIRVQDKHFLAHKVVLACCSEFFRSKLVGRPEDEDKFVLDLHHVTVSGFAPLLEYAYTSTLSISTENIIDVLAAASYMQMFAVASTCSEFMKSSILWNPSNNSNDTMAADKPCESAPESASSNCVLTPLDGSVSPVSSDCSIMERNVPVCRESRRKRKSFVTMASPESPLKCATQMITTSPQVPNPSPSFSDNTAQPVESSLAFPWTFPFGIDRRFHSDKSKLQESPRCQEQTAAVTSEVVVGRRLSDFLTCESSKAVSPPVQAEEDDVRVKVERLSDEEVQDASSHPVNAPQSSLNDQQTVPGSDQVQEDLLISPQSSSIGSLDEGVSEGLPSLQGTSNAGGHAEDDESDFLVPDYLSQVQEEEEALGVQYDLEESQHHPVYAGGSSTVIATSSSSSVQLPVISQVSSSTQNCESSTGLLSPDSLDPLENHSFKMDTGHTVALAEDTKTNNGEEGSSPEVLEQQHHRRHNAEPVELASITIE